MKTINFIHYFGKSTVESTMAALKNLKLMRGPIAVKFFAVF